MSLAEITVHGRPAGVVRVTKPGKANAVLRTLLETRPWPRSPVLPLQDRAAIVNGARVESNLQDRAAILKGARVEGNLQDAARGRLDLISH